MNAIRTINSSQQNINMTAEILELQWDEHYFKEYYHSLTKPWNIDDIQEEFFVDLLWEMDYTREEAIAVMDSLGYYNFTIEEW